ncbi:MAG: hypothetical protein ICV78_16065 [Tolypothrix sp. Co-bin9]|nr:hypothetical protein [Tolypothrix sp. Co-bin9]
MQNILKDKLCKFNVPKHWISVPTLPRTTQGKINQQQLQQITDNFLRLNRATLTKPVYTG